MVEWLNKKLGTRYWYSVRYIYKNNKKEKIFDFVDSVGLTKKGTILNPRKLKKLYVPVHKLNGVPKNLLCNGIFNVEVIAYLGWFKK